METLDSKELGHVFLHELAHLKRRDMQVNWMMSCLQLLHWFNPVIWWAMERIRADRELACDELALSHSEERERNGYGQTIVKLLEDFEQSARLPGVIGILEDKRQMQRRIMMIAKFNYDKKWPALAASILAVLGLIALTDAEAAKDLVSEGPIVNTIADYRDANVGQDVGIKESPKDSNSRSRSGLEIRKVLDVPYKLNSSSHISPDGRHLLGLMRGRRGGDGPPVIVDMATGDMHQIQGPALSYMQYSPDGKQISIWRRDKLQVLDLASAAVRDVYQDGNIGFGYTLDWSPDGKNLLATWYQKEARYEYILATVSQQTGAVTQLMQFENENYPKVGFYSPDGRWIAYELRSGNNQSIRILASDGSGDLPLVERPSNDQLLGWSPSGNRILFLSDRRGSWGAYTLRVVDGATEGDPELVMDGIGLISGLGFSSDGTFFYRTDTEFSDVYMADVDLKSGKIVGIPRNPAKFEGSNRHPAWSRDSRYLAYVSTQGAVTFPSMIGGTVYISDTETQVVRDLVSEVDWPSFPRWHSDGKSLFVFGWLDQEISVVRLDAQSGASTRITKALSFGLGSWPMWSLAPGGRSFYMQKLRSDHTKITQYDLDAGVATESSIPRNKFSTTLSPDGRLFAYSVTTSDSGTLKRKISVVPVGGGEARQILELAGTEAMDLSYRTDNGLAWSHDSRHVLFVKGSANDPKMRSIWRVSIESGESSALGLEMEDLREPVMSPDGKRIAFTAGGKRSQIWAMENFLPALVKNSRP